MTPRTRATQAACAVFQRSSGRPETIFDPLVDALERAELLELELGKQAARLAEERAHHAALVTATRALRREGVNPITWSALVRALSAHSGQRDLPLPSAEA